MSERLTDVSLAIVSAWGQSQRLNECLLYRLVDDRYLLAAVWRREDDQHSQSAITDWALQGSSFTPGSNDAAASRADLSSGVPLIYGDRELGRVIGTPLAETWAAPAPWVEVASRLLGQTWYAEEILQRKKLAALAEFAAGAGHEINNPLATIINRARQLLPAETDPERRRALELIGGQAYRIRDMLGDLMLFARPPAPRLIAVSLQHELLGVMGRFSEEFHQRQVSLYLDHFPDAHGPQPRYVSADPVQLRIVLAELIRNALEAVADRVGVVRIGVEEVRHGSDRVLIRISDNGRGVSSWEAEHLFDPFFSGRQAGRGLGFGLSKCWRIVEQHGGVLKIEPGSEGGTTAFLTWPLHQPSPAPIPSPEVPERPHDCR